MRLFALIVLGALCSGCALTTTTIDVPYQAAATATPVPGAPGSVVEVITADARSTYRDRVSTKKNGYGMEMAAIISSSDLPATFTQAFRQELTARGFRMGTHGADVNVALIRFYNDFKTGFFSGDAIATVAFDVKVTGRDGKMLFSKYYEGTGIEPNIQIMGGGNARAALIKAFASSVSSAMADPDFIQAVLAAGAPAAQLALAAPSG